MAPLLDVTENADSFMGREVLSLTVLWHQRHDSPSKLCQRSGQNTSGKYTGSSVGDAVDQLRPEGFHGIYLSPKKENK